MLRVCLGARGERRLDEGFVYSLHLLDLGGTRYFKRMLLSCSET